jgi:hypothetical protein
MSISNLLAASQPNLHIRYYGEHPHIDPDFQSNSYHKLWQTVL